PARARTGAKPLGGDRETTNDGPMTGHKKHGVFSTSHTTNSPLSLQAWPSNEPSISRSVVLPPQFRQGPLDLHWTATQCAGWRRVLSSHLGRRAENSGHPAFFTTAYPMHVAPGGI